jgi:outer membrane protein assembly factor BamB
MGTAALDLSGKVIWKQTGIKYSPVHGNGGSPALVGDKLIFSCDGMADPFVVALDAKTGDIKWKTPRNTTAKKNFSFCTPLPIEIDGKTQVVLPGSGFVAAYSPDDGKELWKVRYGEGYSVVPRPVFANGILVLSSGFDAPVIYAINPASARGDATASSVAWTNKKSAPNTPSPLVVGDDVYFVSDNGVATCADLKTGNVHWSQRLGNGGFSASPVFADGNIFFLNEAGVGYVIKAGKTFSAVSENDLGERSLASYAVIDGALFVRTDKHLWRIGTTK